MKKLVCFLNVIFVYLVMFVPLFIFFGNKFSFFEMLWEKVFNNNILILIELLLFVYLVILIMNIILCIKVINSDNNVKFLVKSNMIVKISQIPAYVIIFIIGLICLITIFTFAISIALVILDFASLIISGIYAITCYKKLKDNNIITTKELIIYSLLSLVFCADLVISIIAYKKYKNYALKY